jgi:NTP pyrophosphatase (non-canonical NTP hydrolase)
MTFGEYQKLAARTINPNLSTEEQIKHSLYGLSGETGEISSLFQKELQGHELNQLDLMKEIGDALWMLCELCTACGFDIDDIANLNITKLKARYPNGFDSNKSINREV